MTNNMLAGPETVLAEVAPSTARRGIALTMIVGLGALLIYLAFSAPTTPFIWRLILIAIGATALVCADMLRRATASKIEMTSEEIRDTSGIVLCRLDEIESIERGAFAFKPSNGLLIRTHKPQRRKWSPGLWWRMGRRIGIGGVTPAAQAKFMGDLIGLHLKGEKLF